jgi:sugar transferase (PEP-CTERM/EpsH1 system associated)
MNEPVPLIAHIIYRLDFGGLENGLVNLINGLPRGRYRHTVICLTKYSDFAQRIRRDDVTIHALEKKPGKDPLMYARLWKLLRSLSPAIVHTRNLAALDCQIVAAAAGVPRRVHGEHGWDIYDLHGTSTKYNRLRRLCRRFVHRYVPMSRDLEHWLLETVEVPATKIRQIYNGVDSSRFTPRLALREATPWPAEFAGPEQVVIGTVGRMEPVKNPGLLVQAFAKLVARSPGDRTRLRLALIGEGPQRASVERELEDCGVRDLAWVPGGRDDVPDILRSLDVFALPSLNEGISNTILEAMASGLPVVATEVGGNPELVLRGETGELCAAEPEALAAALAPLVDDAARRRRFAAAGRERVEKQFSLPAMLGGYQNLYDELLATGR